MSESVKEVRTTWAGFTVVFAIIGSILLYKGKTSFPWLYGASAFFAFFAIFAPMALLPLFRIWMKFAGAMERFNTWLILLLMFYLMITPTGLIMRLFGHDPMERKIDKNAVTYWKQRDRSHEADRYERQY